MMKLFKGLDLSRRKTRPVHSEADPRAQERFKKLPGLLRGVADPRVEPWFTDKAGIGQKGHMRHV